MGLVISVYDEESTALESRKAITRILQCYSILKASFFNSAWFLYPSLKTPLNESLCIQRATGNLNLDCAFGRQQLVFSHGNENNRAIFSILVIP